MIVTVDFETYYDKDYTLRKLSTSEYIRDKRFEALSCSVKFGDNTPFCYFGEDIYKVIEKLEGCDEVILLAHHAQFDGLILTHHYKYKPAKWACTLSMARALNPKFENNDLGTVAIKYGVSNKLPMPDIKGKHLGDLSPAERDALMVYNNGDVQSCYELYEKMLPGFPPTELGLIDLTVRMFAEPVLKVDLKLAKQELAEEIARKQAAITLSGVDINVLSSNNKFAEELTKRGVTVPMKPSPSVAGKQIPAIAKSDDELQSLVSHSDPKVSALVAGRLAAKSVIGETRAARLIKAGSRGMCLPIYYNYAMAHTLRWSGGDKLNFQNFKQQQRVGGSLSKAIKAPRGYQIVRLDASQIEARITAWLAEEQWVLDAFFDERDLYCEFASEAYGRLITKSDYEERFVGKTCVLGLGFGMGALKLQSTLLARSVDMGITPVRLDISICANLVYMYRKKCAMIEQLWRFMNDKAIATMYMPGQTRKYKCLTFSEGQCKLPNGLALLYPGLRATLAPIFFKKPNSFIKRTTNDVKQDYTQKKRAADDSDDYSSKILDASYLGSRMRSKIYGGLLTENIVQALARIIVADAMLLISERYRVVMMTHDEVVFLAKTRDAQSALEWATELMSASPEWGPDLPLAAEGSYADRYSK